MAWLNVLARANDRIQVYVAPSCENSRGRIELSSGTRLTGVNETPDRADGAIYEDGARLPREPWRRATTEETLSLIAAEPPRNMATTVAIIKLPRELWGDLPIIRASGDADALTNLQHAFRETCELGHPVYCIGPSENPANLKTVTFNPDTRRYNGLHVDNWDQVDLSSRHLATNRLCVNIGRDIRYFLFLPVSLTDIARMLSEEMGPDWGAPARLTVIGRQFMEQFPEVPVVRCRVSPGEAYIAPTENLVHDGSSVGQSTVDRQFTIRGHIRPL
jgi:hypothetical protein